MGHNNQSNPGFPIRIPFNDPVLDEGHVLAGVSGPERGIF
jgi:hypothetical protein